MNLLTYVATELAVALTSYVKDKVVAAMVTKSKAWLTQLFDYVLTKLTGKDSSHWDAGKGALEASIDAAVLHGGAGLLRTLEKLLDEPGASALIALWHEAIAADSGEIERAKEWDISLGPIPSDMGIIDWAKLNARKYGMTVKDVLTRRLASNE